MHKRRSLGLALTRLGANKIRRRGQQLYLVPRACNHVRARRNDKLTPPHRGASATAMFVVQIVFAGVAGPLMSSGLIAAAVVLSLLPLVSVFALLSLLVTHVYLRLYLGMTTQEYLDDRGRKRGNAELEKEARRVETRRKEIDESADTVRKEWLAAREKEKQERVDRERRRPSAFASSTAAPPPPPPNETHAEVILT